jgi:hypothetical protein
MIGSTGKPETIKRIMVTLWTGVSSTSESRMSSERSQKAFRRFTRADMKTTDDFVSRYRELCESSLEVEKSCESLPAVCMRGHDVTGLSVFIRQIMTENQTVAEWMAQAESDADYRDEMESHVPLDKIDRIALASIQRIVVNTCLYLRSEDPATKKPVWSPGDKGAGSGGKIWTVGRGVKISKEIRSMANSVAAGLSKSSPLMRHVVRGHCKTQRHGAGRQQVKSIYVMPYWRGPVEGPIVERKYDLR